MEVYDKIRDIVRSSTIWEEVSTGNSDRRCKILSKEVIGLLVSIEGLNVLQVYNIELTDHSWIIAHHPEVGYFMIDATAGQFLITHKETSLRFNDVFIGTMSDLKTLASNYDMPPIEKIWSPALTDRIHVGHRGDTIPATERALWSKYPDGDILFDRSDIYDVQAFVARAYRDHGYEWREIAKQLHYDIDEIESRLGLQL